MSDENRNDDNASISEESDASYIESADVVLPSVEKTSFFHKAKAFICRLFFSVKFTRILSVLCAVFISLALVSGIVFFTSGGVSLLTAEASGFTVVVSETEHSFETLGETFVLSAYVEPDEGLTLEFESSNEDIVTVSPDGTVTAVKGGVAAVEAYCILNGQRLSGTCACTVNVTNDVTDEAGAEDGVWMGSDEGYVPEIPSPKLDEDGFLCSDNIIGYFQMNSDTVAWIYLPGTNINIPIAQAPASDPDYYLNHGFNRYLKYSGSAFVEPGSKLSTYGGFTSMSELNTVIYGHAKGTDIFDQLERKLILSSWYSKTSNRYVYINTMTECTVWQIFAAYYTDFGDSSDKAAVVKTDYTLTTEQIYEKYSEEYITEMTMLGQLQKLAIDGDKFASVANDWRSRVERSDSRYRPFANALSNREYGGVTVSADDRIISLVTCADANSDVRFVVQAKLIKSKNIFTDVVTEYGG